MDYFSTSHLKPDLKKHAVRGAGITVLAQILSQSVQFVSTIILARILTPEDFGLVAMVASIYVVFRICRNAGLTDATIQAEEINHQQISTLFWINIAFGAIITLIFAALAPLMSWFYKEPKLISIAIILSLDFVLGGLSTQHRALLKRNLLFARYSANEIAATIISITAAIVLALIGWGYWALVAKYMVYAIAEVAGAWTLCRWRPGLPARGTGVRHMLRFGLNMLKNFSINYFSQDLDKILVGWRSGAQSLGHYTRAYHLFMAPAQQLTYPLVGIAVATMSRLGNEPNKYRRYYLNALSTLAFIGLPFSAILTLSGNDIVLLLLGPQWKEAAGIFSVFGFGIGIQILYGTHSWLHISQGKPERWLRWNFIAASVIITSFIIGLPFGALGVAAAYIISLYILLIPSLWYAGKPVDIKISSIFKTIWRYYLSALIAGLVSWFVLHSFGITSSIFLELDIFIRILAATTLCIFIYLLLVVALYQSVKPISQFTSLLRDMMPFPK